MTKIGTVFDIQRFCLHDGPGIRTTVFLKGCPLSCAWCHNPESKSAKPQLSFLASKCVNCQACAKMCKNDIHTFENDIHNIDFKSCHACGNCVNVCLEDALKIVGKPMTACEVLEIVCRDANYYASSQGGVTISGGEPLFQLPFTLELLKLAKQKGLHTCLETCGFANSPAIANVAPYVDIFLYDFKLSDSEAHLKYTQVPLQPILDNLHLLDSLGATLHLRCPIIPTVNDNTAHFAQIAQLSKLSCIKQVELMPYHTLGVDKSKQIGANYSLNVEFATDDQAQEWKQLLKTLGCKKLV